MCEAQAYAYAKLEYITICVYSSKNRICLTGFGHTLIVSIDSTTRDEISFFLFRYFHQQRPEIGELSPPLLHMHVTSRSPKILHY